MRKIITTSIPPIGSRHTANIVYPDPEEDFLSTPITLPTTEPVSYLDYFSIRNYHLPQGIGASYVPVIVLGMSKPAESRTIKGSVFINDDEVDSQYINNTSETDLTCMCIGNVENDVSIGDSMGVKMWCANDDVVLNYVAHFVWPTRFSLGMSGRNSIYDVSITFSAYPSLSETYTYDSWAPLALYYIDGSYETIYDESTYDFSLLLEHGRHKYGGIYLGDIVPISFISKSSKEYDQQIVPTSITYHTMRQML